MKKTVIISILCSVILFAGGIATAQTNDTQTPAEEWVCDSLLNGVNDSLWGLCNAFCEAKDCDLLLKLDKSCSQILNNFEKRSGGKISMPCMADNFCVTPMLYKYFNPVDD